MSNLAVYLTLICVTSSVVTGISFPDLSADISEASSDSAQVHELLACSPETNPLPGEQIFDVTKYGAVNDGLNESSQAFLLAWKDACAYAEKATLYIPEGIFFLGPVSFSGPCSNLRSPNVEIRGTLIAQPDLNAFPNSYWIEFKQLNGISFAGGNEAAVLDAQGGVAAWKQASCSRSEKCQKLVTSLKFTDVSNGDIRNIAVSNSKGFHVGLDGCDNINIYNVAITAPGDSPNTDGIHVGKSTNINIAGSKIGVGDDCISIGPGSVNISVTGVHCGPGHGISVGSLGRNPDEKDVMGISVRNCTINSTRNGVRVKTWPGAPASNAFNFTFEDILMSNVSNPIIIDQEYCPSRSCNTSQASLVKISDVKYKNINGTYNSDFGANLQCSSSVPCENIQFTNVGLNDMNPKENPGQIRINEKNVNSLFWI